MGESPSAKRSTLPTNQRLSVGECGPLSLASNGLPYEIDSFKVTGKNPGGTAAFDKAEAEGTPLKVDRVEPARRVTDAMPLDQRVVSFR
jgi:hypothetical protein